MGLIDFLMGRKNLTFDWQANPNLKVVVDLDRHAVCGAELGGPIARLSGLGPDDEPRKQTCFFRWRRHGLYVEEDEGRLESFVIELAASPPYSGAWRFRGREVALGRGTTRDQARALLGEPFHAYDEPDAPGETVFFYAHPKAEWQLAWDGEELDSVEVNAYCELSSDRARARYGCAKEWPYPVRED